MISSANKNLSSPWDDEDIRKTKPVNKNDLFNEHKQNFNNFLNRNLNGDFNNIIKIIISVVVVMWLLSGVYIIQEGESALVLRFGKYVRTSYTGLNYHLPTPIEEVLIESTGKIRKVEIGFRSSAQKNFIHNNIIKSVANNPARIAEESLMLTGDENILDINFVVQWKISNLKDYAFNLSNPEEAVKSAAESSMREIIANTKLSVALTDGRSKIQHGAKDLLQNMLDAYNAGIEITALQMQKVDPPSEVTDAFRDVQTAKTDKERLINEAYAYRNDLLPRARGDAAAIVQDGMAYKTEIIEKAKGDVSRFNAIYVEYKKASDITKKRIYLETMENILQNANKMVIDSQNSGMVPYLSLPKMDK